MINMGMTKMDFVMFYSVFLLFITYISGLAGFTFISMDTSLQENIPTDQSSFSILNPFSVLFYFLAFLSVSSEFVGLYIIVLLPMIITAIWMFAEWLRGV